MYYLNARYYSPEWRRFISPNDTSYLDPDSVNGLNPYCYCNNDSVNYNRCDDCTETSNISSSLSIGGVSVKVSRFGTGLSGNPPAPGWLQTMVGAVPDIILGIRYLAAKGMHSKFVYATKARYMCPIMGGTWRWFGKSNSSFLNFGMVTQGTFRQVLTGDAKAGFGAIAKSAGGVIALSALVNFGFNLYENNWQVDAAMITDTIIDTAIGVGAYYLAAGTMSLIAAGLVVTAGASLPGVVVVGGVLLLSIGFEWAIREIFDYHQ